MDPKKPIVPILLLVLGAVLVIGAVVAFAIQTGSAARQAQNLATVPVAQNTGIQRVTLADAKAAYDGKQAVFVDVRDTASFQAGHVSGALNIPINELQQRYKELKPNDWIITYCT